MSSILNCIEAKRPLLAIILITHFILICILVIFLFIDTPVDMPLAP